jgi:hypothetical protein
MLPSIHNASTEQTATVRPDLTLYASLELSRATMACHLPIARKGPDVEVFDARRRWWRAARSAGATRITSVRPTPHMVQRR